MFAKEIVGPVDSIIFLTSVNMSGISTKISSIGGNLEGTLFSVLGV